MFTLSSNSFRFRFAFGRTGLFLLLMMTSLVSAQQPAVAAKEEKVILVVGDSLAAGHGVDPDKAFPAIVQAKIEHTGWPFIVVNAGVSGDTSAGGLRRIDWLLRRKISVLVLELGGNDGLRGISPEATRTNLQGIITRTKARYPEVQVVVAGMKMPPNLGPDYGARFEKVFPTLAAENRVHLIPFLLEGVGGIPELNQPDRIHPNAAGHQILAENVWKVLRPVLEKQLTKPG